ncbi:MAG: hypothetical protein WD066_06085 [Planctomycetaceae bacterium]
MATSRELEHAALEWTRAELVRIWAELKLGNRIPGWDPGRAFEYLVIRAFHLEAPTDTRWPYIVTIPRQRLGSVEQIDGIVYVDGVAFLIESKARDEPTAIDAIAKLRFRLEGRPPGTMGLLFSLRDYTTATELFAQFAVPLNVLLWSAGDLDKALEHGTMISSLRDKYRHAVEQGWAYHTL